MREPQLLTHSDALSASPAMPGAQLHTYHDGALPYGGVASPAPHTGVGPHSFKLQQNCTSQGPPNAYPET